MLQLIFSPANTVVEKKCGILWLWKTKYWDTLRTTFIITHLKFIEIWLSGVCYLFTPPFINIIVYSIILQNRICTRWICSPSLKYFQSVHININQITNGPHVRNTYFTLIYLTLRPLQMCSGRLYESILQCYGRATRVYLNFLMFWTLRRRLPHSKVIVFLSIDGSTEWYSNTISYDKELIFRWLFWGYLQYKMALVSGLRNLDYSI